MNPGEETAPVVLIGGPPGAGKTTLGRAVAAHLGYTSMTGDDLVTALRALTTDESHPALRPMKPHGGHVRYFTDRPLDGMIEDAVALGDLMWPAIERLVDYRRSSGPPLVLDWWLLSPDRVAALSSELCASVWLHIDIDVLEARERRLEDFYGASDRPETMLSNFMARSRWRNDWVAETARHHGLPVVFQDGSKSVETLVDEAVAALPSV